MLTLKNFRYLELIELCINILIMDYPPLLYYPNTSTGQPSPDSEAKLQECLQQCLICMKENYPASSDFSLSSDGRTHNDYSIYTGYGGNLFLY